MKKVILIVCILILIQINSPLISGPQSDQEKFPDYSNTPRKDVPAEYTWRIEDLFDSKEAWDAEKERIFGLMKKIDAQAPDWTSSASKMLAFYTLLDEIRMGQEKLTAYARHQANMDMANPLYRRMGGELNSRFIQFRAKLSFMQDDILKLGEEKFAEYLKAEPGLKPYAFNVYDIFREKEHILPPEQQKIMSMTGLFSRVPSQASGTLNNLDIPHPKITLSTGEEVTLNYPTYSRLREAKNPDDRQLVMDVFWANIKKYENTFAVLVDGAMKNHLFSAKVRKFDNTLQARLFRNNIDPAVYHMLIEMTRKNLDVLHRYLKLKKEMLELETFRYVDMYASAVKSIDKEFGWEEARTIIQDALNPMGPEYAKVIQEAFDNRWIDRYPNKGKQSGAYSSGVYAVHPFIKMNYTGNYSNVSTLAHELGHALHSYLSDKNQPYPLADYSTFLAEIASTLNEHLLVNHLLKKETDDLFKLYLLDNYLNGIKGTVYRQTHFAEFELAMHQHVESNQTLTAQWLNDTFLETTRSTYGHDKGITQVDDYIQNEWSVIPHFFMNYYVYSYATGMIASSALAEMVLNEGEEGRNKALAFLSAGGSDYPLNVLKRASVDMTQPEPYEAAFKHFGNLVSEMEQLVKKLKEEKGE
jgi:oligoendopeptidase F